MLRYTAWDLNNTLSVAAKILDVTNPSTPVAVGTIQMQSSGINGGYFLFYQAPFNKRYLVNMMPYNDPGTWDSPNTNYTPGDSELEGENGETCPTAQSVIGFVNNPAAVIGLVNNPNNVAGFVNCDCD